MPIAKCEVCGKPRSNHDAGSCVVSSLDSIRRSLHIKAKYINSELEIAQRKLFDASAEISKGFNGGPEISPKSEMKGGSVMLFKIFIKSQATAHLTNRFFVVSGEDSSDAENKIEERGYEVVASEYLFGADVYLKDIDLQEEY